MNSHRPNEERMGSLVRFRFVGVGLSFAFAAVSSLAQGTTASPQVQVTFYSSGSFLRSAIPGDKHAKFAGRIMDGNNQLAMLTPNQFVTFNLDPGQHVLAANSWMIASPVGGGHLKINLVPTWSRWSSPLNFGSSSVLARRHSRITRLQSPLSGSILRSTAWRELSPKPYFRSVPQPRLLSERPPSNPDRSQVGSPCVSSAGPV